MSDLIEFLKANPQHLEYAAIAIGVVIWAIVFLVIRLFGRQRTEVIIRDYSFTHLRDKCIEKCRTQQKTPTEILADMEELSRACAVIRKYDEIEME